MCAQPHGQRRDPWRASPEGCPGAVCAGGAAAPSQSGRPSRLPLCPGQLHTGLGASLAARSLSVSAGSTGLGVPRWPILWGNGLSPHRRARRARSEIALENKQGNREEPWKNPLSPLPVSPWLRQLLLFPKGRLSTSTRGSCCGHRHTVLGQRASPPDREKTEQPPGPGVLSPASLLLARSPADTPGRSTAPPCPSPPSPATRTRDCWARPLAVGSAAGQTQPQGPNHSAGEAHPKSSSQGCL